MRALSMAWGERTPSEQELPETECAVTETDGTPGRIVGLTLFRKEGWQGAQKVFYGRRAGPSLRRAGRRAAPNRGRG